MWPSGSRSNRGAALACVLAAAVASPVGAAPSPSAPQALLRMFPPPATIERQSVFLTDDQAARVAEVGGVEVPTRLVTRWIVGGPATEAGAIRAAAYLDTHLVRTVPETLMIVVDGDGRVLRVEVLRFDEPREYRPSDRWFRQFADRALDEDLALKRGIRTLTGATLSSRAATAAVRRALAVHAIVPPGGGGP